MVYPFWSSHKLPLCLELLFAPLSDLRRVHVPGTRPVMGVAQLRAGNLCDGDWDEGSALLLEQEKYRALRRRFADGLDWEETGLPDYIRKRIARRGVFDGCRTERDIVERCARADAVFQQVRHDMRVRVPYEINPSARAQRYGIWAHLARDGRFLFGSRGHHRVTMASVLGLTEVPISLAMVHPQAVEAGHLERLRGARAERLEELKLDLPRRAMSIRRAGPGTLRRRLKLG